MRQSNAVLCLCAMLLAAGGCTHEASVVPKPPPVAAADAPAINDFKARVKQYVELRDSENAKLPKLPEKTQPEKITAHKLSLADAVRKARTPARQGDIFTPKVRDYLSEVIHSEMRGRAGQPVREAVKDGNPRFEKGTTPPPATLVVNARYPETQPLSQMPPTLLARLPELPEDLHYRFVGRDLILYDEKTGLVVDIMPAAAPPLSGGKS